jgi:hypothetical protein
MAQDDGPIGLDGVRVCFDGKRVVSDAGVISGCDGRAAARDRGAYRPTRRLPLA